MLRIVEGGFSSAAYEEIKSEILKLTNEGRRVFLIVPEQQTVSAEKEMAEFLPDSAPLTFEVTNFTRLANTVYRQLGGIAGEYSDSGKESLIMWRTLTELSPFLSMTNGREEINTGTVKKALAAVAEMKSIAALPSELAALAENEGIKENARLSRKLSDISKIMTLYKRLLEEKYTSAKDECERLAAKLEENPGFFDGTFFFISGFTSFTEPQCAVMSHLMKSSDVTLHLALSKTGYDLFEFSEIVRTKEKILRTADRAGVSKNLLRREAVLPGKPPLLDDVCGLLWRNFGKADEESAKDDGTIRIFEAQDPYEECDFIAADIKRRVMEGSSFKDFAIIMRDAESYAGIIDSSLGKADIPAFISIRKDISSFEAVKLIYTAFAVVTGGFKREDVISYTKCRLCGVSADACDEFELYTEMWQISGERFTDGILWNMSPNGYSTESRADYAEILKRIDETRRAVTEPLMRFKEDINEAKTVRDHAIALTDFLTSLSVEEKINERRLELISLGEADAAEESERLWEIICSALDSLVEVLGDIKINASGFESQLRVLLSEADIGKIPSFYDAVTVGSADMIRLTDKKHVYLVGVNQGEFPRPPKDNSYFTERDRLTLASLGVLTETDGDIPGARELFFFSRAFAAANESVTLLYSVRDDSFTASAKADIIDRISYICHGRIKPKKISELSIAERIYYPDAALDASDDADVRAALIDAGYGRELAVSEGNISNGSITLDGKVIDIMYPGDLALTQTRIDTYVGCPFAYFLRYNLKLSENERAEFDARNIGTFIHALLENFFAELRKDGKCANDITESDKREMVERAAKKYLSSLSEGAVSNSKRIKIVLDRLCRTAMPVVDGLCDELKDCGFVPSFFELRIGNESEELPRPAAFKSDDGKNVYVYGSIDRVDTYKSGKDVFVRVIDYKTGSKTFSPDDIDEGKNLQMFLYLKAIADTDNKNFLEKLGVEDGGRIIPAGVIYVKTDMSDVTVPRPDKEAAEEALKKKQERRGMILDDAESIGAMNKDFIPIRFKKDGTPDARSEKYLYTYEGWNALNEKISDKVREISSAIKSGDVSPTSKKSDTPCDYCRFKPVCRKKIN